MSTSFNSSYISPRTDLLEQIRGDGLSVLDVGCATGSNGKYLLDKGIAQEVVGFEFDPEMAAIANQFYAQVHIGDLDVIDVDQLLGDRQFDYIILGDVLEHLKSPWKLLSTFVNRLSENGRIIISLPNIQHIDMFIHVYIKGVWPYNDRGIFDRTHLRFFTLKTMLQLIEGAGLDVVRTERQFRRRDYKGSSFNRSPFEWLLMHVFKNLYTFQFVFVCTHNGKSQP
ncbi:class I SAM-dependent methyltransferase [Candidatus Litorirhabdus singularis]|uniref:class I SAM-dependent methyltransferase n=1 Tax=Candidatus Litorirhabdus singularis TaxID=2518993 RepID=UPI0024316631|nr:class I SAM-dependent methyltransferase [Candidatus Litorirhabdus singularis]